MNHLLDRVVMNIEIMRDNSIAWDSLSYSDETAKLLAIVPPNINHAREIDARMADDLRKLSVATARFRQACVINSINKFKPRTTEEYQRHRREMIETARDLRFIFSHIDPALDPR